MAEVRIVEYIAPDKQIHKISYELTQKNVKNMNMRIKPNLKVQVSANPRVSKGKVDSFVISKGDFILKALAEYQNRETCQTEDLRYKSGEQFYFLGKEYPILVLQSDSNEALILDDTFVIKVTDLTNFRLKEKIVGTFIDCNCEKIFVELSQKVYEQFKSYKIPFPKLKMQDMKSQWGSCNKYKCIINLNKRLIHSPIKSIEYVIVHEFAHLVYADHSKNFHAVVSDIMPDWKQHKNALISF